MDKKTCLATFHNCHKCHNFLRSPQRTHSPQDGLQECGSVRRSPQQSAPTTTDTSHRGRHGAALKSFCGLPKYRRTRHWIHMPKKSQLFQVLNHLTDHRVNSLILVKQRWVQSMPTQNSKHFYHFSGKDMLAMTHFRISQPSASRIPPSRCQDNAQGPRKRQLWQLPAVASTWPGPKFTATQLHTTSRCRCCHIVETWWNLHCHILYFSLEKFRTSLEVDSDFAVYSDFWEDCLSAITCCSSGNTITWRFGRQSENVRTC